MMGAAGVRGAMAASETKRVGSGAATDRARALHVLNAVAEALHTAPDLEQALTRTLALTADFMGLHSGWVWLRDPDSGQYYSAATLNLPPYLQEPVRMAGGRSCWCLETFAAGALTAKNVDVIECSRLRPALQ